jgi:hypothetical protein
MGINCSVVCQDANFVGHSNNGYRPNQGFNAASNKPSFSFDNYQLGGSGQNFNKSEPFLKENVRDQLRINSKIGKKLLANYKVLEGINSTMNNFTVAVQNQLNCNKTLEMRIA